MLLHRVLYVTSPFVYVFRLDFYLLCLTMSLFSHSYIRPLIYLFFLDLFIYGVVASTYLCFLLLPVSIFSSPIPFVLSFYQLFHVSKTSDFKVLMENFMFCWRRISIQLCGKKKTNLMRNLLLHFVNLQSNQHNRQSSKKKNNTNCCMHTVVPPDDGHRCARNM
jgi:hypothetical protein